MSCIGKWMIGQRRNGKFYASVMQRAEDGSICTVHMQDSRTGEDAAFDTQKAASQAIRALVAPAKCLC